MLDKWIGQWVIVEHIGGLDPDTETFDAIVKEGMTFRTHQVQIKMEVLFLANYNQLGIEVRDWKDEQEAPNYFLPWDTITKVQGFSPEHLELVLKQQPEEAESQQDRPEQTEEAGLSDRRQELMDMMASAGIPTQVAVARGAADTWLADHPSDGDVRAARDRLADVNPTGD